MSHCAEISPFGDRPSGSQSPSGFPPLSSFLPPPSYRRRSLLPPTPLCDTRHSSRLAALFFLPLDYTLSFSSLPLPLLTSVLFLSQLAQSCNCSSYVKLHQPRQAAGANPSRPTCCYSTTHSANCFKSDWLIDISCSH